MAIPELASVRVGGMTRSSFILRSALAAGAVYGGAAVGPFVKRAFAQGEATAPDTDILNFALTVEILEATFYEQALQRVGLAGDVRALTEEIESNESEHVDGLRGAIEELGGTPEDPPRLDFGNAFSSESSYLQLAQTFEDTGVSAYNGAAPSIQDKDVLAQAAAIVQVEGRHASLVRAQRGEPVAPTAFDETLEMREVENALSPYIKP
jgi:rubrerythrin